MRCSFPQRGGGRAADDRPGQVSESRRVEIDTSLNDVGLTCGKRSSNLRASALDVAVSVSLETSHRSLIRSFASSRARRCQAPCVMNEEPGTSGGLIIDRWNISAQASRDRTSPRFPKIAFWNIPNRLRPPPIAQPTQIIGYFAFFCFCLLAFAVRIYFRFICSDLWAIITRYLAQRRARTGLSLNALFICESELH